MKTHFLRYLKTGVFELSEITEIIKQQKGYVIDYQGINRLYSNGFLPLRVLLLLVLTAFIVARLFGIYFIIFLCRVILLLLLSLKG